MFDEDIRLFGRKGTLTIPVKSYKHRYYNDNRLILQANTSYDIYILSHKDVYDLRTNEVYVDVDNQLFSFDQWSVDFYWQACVRIGQQEFTADRLHRMLLWLYDNAVETEKELCRKVDR